MSSRTGNWMMVAGAAMMLGGLCILPAAFVGHGEGNLLGVGACLFGLGALVVAAGVYLKARALQAGLGLGTNAEPEKSGRRPKVTCDLCRIEAPVVHCKVHQLHLCGNCLAEHYDFRSCAYVPSPRRGTKKSNRGMAKARGA